VLFPLLSPGALAGVCTDLAQCVCNLGKNIYLFTAFIIVEIIRRKNDLAALACFDGEGRHNFQQKQPGISD
jgi:hypothetical protein